MESKIQPKPTYLQNKNRFTNTENKLVVAQGVGSGGGKDWRFGNSRGKLLYIGWISKKVLLCSTGSYIQYPTVSQNENEYEKVYLYT